MERKDPLDADAAGNPSDGEVGGGPVAVLKADDNTLEHLDPLPVPFTNPEVDLDGIAGAEVGDIGVEFGFKQLSGFHEMLPA